MRLRFCIILVALQIVATLSAFASDVLTVAVFDFESKDDAVRELGPKVASLVSASLSADPRIITVERAELDKALGELEMGLSGTIDPATAAKVGHLTGAKVLVTGRVFKIERDTCMVAKIIGTETSRVYGEIVKGPPAASPTDMAADLAKRIADTTVKQADTLVAKVEKPEDRIEEIRKALKTDKLPVVEVKISERHYGGPTIDPAAQTELAYILQKCGFTVVDEKSVEKPDLEFVGEAFSEFAMRKGNLVSCKARVELKLREKATGKVLAVDRQTSIAVDLSEQMAAKTALQQATQELAERMIPEMAKR